MPLNNMKTWADGELVTAASMNAEIRNPINSLTPGHQVVTTAQKTALTSVATGTMVYDSTLNRLQVWNGSAWIDAPRATVTPSVSVRRTTNLSFANPNSVDWSTVAAWDTDGFYIPGTSTQTLTIPYAGLYSVFTQGYVTASGTMVPANSFLFLTKIPAAGGTEIIGYIPTLLFTTASLNWSGCFHVSFLAGDRLRLQINISGGSAWVVNGSATEDTNQSRMTVTMVTRTS